MIFVSKGDVGIITDSLFSIDATGGIDVTLDDQGSPWETKTEPKHNFL